MAFPIYDGGQKFKNELVDSTKNVVKKLCEVILTLTGKAAASTSGIDCEGTSQTYSGIQTVPHPEAVQNVKICDVKKEYPVFNSYTLTDSVIIPFTDNLTSIVIDVTTVSESTPVTLTTYNIAASAYITTALKAGKTYSFSLSNNTSLLTGEHKLTIPLGNVVDVFLTIKQ